MSVGARRTGSAAEPAATAARRCCSRSRRRRRERSAPWAPPAGGRRAARPRARVGRRGRGPWARCGRRAGVALARGDAREADAGARGGAVELDDQAGHVDARAGWPCRDARSRRSRRRSRSSRLLAPRSACGACAARGAAVCSATSFDGRGRLLALRREQEEPVAPTRRTIGMIARAILRSRSVRVTTHLRGKPGRATRRAGPRWPARAREGHGHVELVVGAAAVRRSPRPAAPTSVLDSFSSTSVTRWSCAHADHHRWPRPPGSGVQPDEVGAWAAARCRRSPSAGGRLRAAASPVTEASAAWSQLPAGITRDSSRIRRSQSKRVSATVLTDASARLLELGEVRCRRPRAATWASSWSASALAGGGVVLALVHVVRREDVRGDHQEQRRRARRARRTRCRSACPWACARRCSVGMRLTAFMPPPPSQDPAATV